MNAVSHEIEPAEKPAFSLLSAQKLNLIYARMLKSRQLAECTGSPTGREAALVASLVEMRSGDALILAQPDPQASYIKGTPLSELAIDSAEEIGQEAAAESIIDTAWEFCKRRKSEVVFALLPEAWATQPCWLQMLETVRDRRLPVLAICFSGRDLREPSEAASPFDPGFPAIPVDLQDAPAVYRVASEALSRARSGCWPTFLECVALPAEQLPGGADPIARMEEYLRGKGFFREEARAQALAEFEREWKSSGIRSVC